MHINGLFFTVILVMSEMHMQSYGQLLLLSSTSQKPISNNQIITPTTVLQNLFSFPSLERNRQNNYCMEILLTSVWVGWLSLLDTTSGGWNLQDKRTYGSSIHILSDVLARPASFNITDKNPSRIHILFSFKKSTMLTMWSLTTWEITQQIWRDSKWF